MMQLYVGVAALIVSLFASVAQAQDPAPLQTSVGRLPYAVLLGGQSAELLSGLHFVAQGHTNANRVMGDRPAKMVLMKAGGTMALVGMMKLLERAGVAQHSKAAIWTSRLIGYGAGGIGLWSALSNEVGLRSVPLPPGVRR